MTIITEPFFWGMILVGILGVFAGYRIAKKEK